MSDDARVVCVQCAAINRLTSERPPEEAKCGRCGAHLFDGKPADVSGEMFDRQVSKGTVPVIVDVWAPWCGPCRTMAPQYEDAASEIEPGARFIKLNSDAEPSIASRLGIRGIPTMILFKDNRELDRVSGAMSARQIQDWVRARI